jgi:peptidoglycan/xylan/chitin deacetylase (PgdA/CDA1 family)
MNIFKYLALTTGTIAFRASSAARAHQPSARAILNHNYFFPGEPKQHSIDRLRRQLDWLQNVYEPTGVPELLEGLQKKVVPHNSIVVTTDDACLDIYEVSEEFKKFGVPLAVFVCVGWISLHDFSESDSLVRAVDALEWYRGPDTRLHFGDKYTCDLSAAKRSENIDWILNEREILWPHLEELCTKIENLQPQSRHSKRTLCNWKELQELASSGVHIGAHSISHGPIATMSAVRRRFEINESKRILEAKCGACKSFAYPYGVRGTYDDITQNEVKAAGFQAAFLTHSDVVTAASPIFELPRISIPDVPLSLAEYKARVRGGGILFQRIKSFLPSA